MGISKLNKLKKTNNGFDKNKELVDKMKKGFKIKLVNNLSNGTVSYQCAISRMDYNLDNYKQELVLGFDEFSYLVNSKKKILKNFDLMPVECEIDDYDNEEKNLLNRVLRIFGLANIYDIDEENKGGDYLYEDVLDDILDSKLKYSDFVGIVEEIPLALYEKVIMRAIEFCRSGELSDMQKINYLIDSTDNPDLFMQEVKEDSKIRKIR